MSFCFERVFLHVFLLSWWVTVTLLWWCLVEINRYRDVSIWETLLPYAFSSVNLISLFVGIGLQFVLFQNNLQELTIHQSFPVYVFYLFFPLQGYCGWSLVVFDRLLLPGNPDIGVLRYQDRYYVFSSKQAAYEFASEPQRYIAYVTECAKKSPQLIQLLELHAQFATITPYTQVCILSSSSGHK